MSTVPAKDEDVSIFISDVDKPTGGLLRLLDTLEFEFENGVREWTRIEIINSFAGKNCAVRVWKNR